MTGEEHILCPLVQFERCQWGSRTVVEAVGGNCKDELIRRLLGRSDSGDENTYSNVTFCSLQRDPDEGGTPVPCRFSDNKNALTDIY